MLAGEIPSVNNIWLIGDQFLINVFHALQQLQVEAKEARRQEPYIYEFYNVSCFTASPNSVIKSMLARLVNSLVKALNDCKKLPRIIMVIPDWDILKFLDHKTFGIKMIAEDAVGWIITQMNRAIESKKDTMRRRKPGSVVTGQPKVIWVTMMNRMNAPCKMLAHRMKFNDAVEKHLAIHMNYYILDVAPAMMDSSYFDPRNRINSYGKAQFWLEIDQQLELFDKQKLSLRPTQPDLRSEVNMPKESGRGQKSSRSSTKYLGNNSHYEKDREHRYHRF